MEVTRCVRNVDGLRIVGVGAGGDAMGADVDYVRSMSQHLKYIEFRRPCVVAGKQPERRPEALPLREAGANLEVSVFLTPRIHAAQHA